MASGEREQAVQPTALKIVPGRTEDAPRGYANHVRVTFTPEDFTLFFGWYAIPPLDEPPESGQVTAEVQTLIGVTLPLNLVRSVIAVLQRQVEGYEQSFGPIPPHPARPAWMVAAEEEKRDDG